jgi:hypothetical protein
MADAVGRSGARYGIWDYLADEQWTKNIPVGGFKKRACTYPAWQELMPTVHAQTTI